MEVRWWRAECVGDITRATDNHSLGCCNPRKNAPRLLNTHCLLLQHRPVSVSQVVWFTRNRQIMEMTGLAPHPGGLLSPLLTVQTKIFIRGHTVGTSARPLSALGRMSNLLQLPGSVQLMRVVPERPYAALEHAF